MRYETFIARRYLRSRRRTRFISIIGYFSIGGVAIGVAALAIVLSTMNGLETEVREKLLDMDAHVKVTTFRNRGIEGSQWPALMDTIRGVPGVIGVTPFVEVQAMLKAYDRTTAIIRGIDTATADEVYSVRASMDLGELDLGRFDLPPGVPGYGMVAGRDLAEIDIGPVGTSGTLAALPEDDADSPMMSIFPSPNLRNFLLTGTFRSGLYEYDRNYAYVSLETAQGLAGMRNKVSGLAIRVEEMGDAERVAQAIDAMLPYPYYVYTWIDQNRNLFSWMTIEKWAMFIVLALIILVAAFNIISTLIMVVLEKKGEIGILKAMGATSRSIQRVFVTQGMTVGLIGTAIGLVIGYGFCWAQQTFRLISLPPDVYFISAVPIDMRPLDAVLVTVVSILICLGASVYPARRAAELAPVEAIRDE
ncbi:FtsX-like permease family protein [Gemmatimonadota bacterium]